MLRLATLAVSLVAIFVGLAGIFTGRSELGQFLYIGLLIFLAVRFERWRYTKRAEPEDGPWETTTERFVDPGSGKVMVVLRNQKTGERRYVDE